MFVPSPRSAPARAKCCEIGQRWRHEIAAAATSVFVGRRGAFPRAEVAVDVGEPDACPPPSPRVRDTARFHCLALVIRSRGYCAA